MRLHANLGHPSANFPELVVRWIAALELPQIANGERSENTPDILDFDGLRHADCFNIDYRKAIEIRELNDLLAFAQNDFRRSIGTWGVMLIGRQKQASRV